MTVQMDISDEDFFSLAESTGTDPILSKALISTLRGDGSSEWFLSGRFVSSYYFAV